MNDQIVCNRCKVSKPQTAFGLRTVPEAEGGARRKTCRTCAASVARINRAKRKAAAHNGEPPLSARDVRAALRLSEHAMAGAIASGEIPAPDASIGRQRMWHAQTIAPLVDRYGTVHLPEPLLAWNRAVYALRQTAEA